MAKRIQDSSRQRGESLLREWGVGEDVAALRAAWGREADGDAAVLERLGRLASPDSVAALLELENATSDKSVRKEIRRALFRLEQRGLAVPKAQPAPTVVTLGAVEVEGYMSASDGNGDQLLWLVKPRRGELAHLFAVINDPTGMREVEMNQVTRKTLRSAREDLLSRHGIRIVEVDWRYCDQRMRQAHRWALERGTTVQGDYVGARGQILQEEPAAEVEHPILAVVDRAALEEAAIPEKAMALLDEPELRTWFFPPEMLHAYIEEIAAAQTSPLLLNEHQQRERVEQILARAIREVFGGEAQESWRRRILDLAWVLHASQRQAAARAAVATAEALKTSSGGTGVHFCEALLRFSFAAHMRAVAERDSERARDSLVLTPQEAAARAAAQRRGPR